MAAVEGTVPCHEVHQYEVTGVVDLHDGATRATRQAQAVAVSREQCPQRLLDHLGGDPIPGVSWSWIPVEQDDLDGGVRGLVCLGVRFEGTDATDLVGPLRP